MPGSVVHTDGWNGYSGLAAAGYKHQVTVIKSGAVPGHILDAPKADAADAAAALLGRHRDDGLGLDFPSSLALFRPPT